jgi:drug/metabolite transporter (DMT)-like permease
MRLRGHVIAIAPGTLIPGLMIGLCFALEFTMLFIAVDLTTVTRTSVLLYTMPLWFSLAAHFVMPDHKITLPKALGLAMSFIGVVIALAFRDGGSGGSIWGDLMAIGSALCWAGIALLARATRLQTVPPETQLLWQLAISAPILLALSPLFGPLLRDPSAWHWAGLGFQIIGVASAGFLVWLSLLAIYPAASVAAFSFLTPIFGVSLGWLLLDEPLGREIILALGLVCGGLVLINRPAKAASQSG